MKKLALLSVSAAAVAVLTAPADAANLTQHWLLNEDFAQLHPDYEPSGDRAIAAALINQVAGGNQNAQFVKGTSVDDPAPLFGAPAPGALANGSTGAAGTSHKDSHLALGNVAPGTDPFTLALWFYRDGSASIEGLHTQFHIIGANQSQAGRWNVHAQNLNTETGTFNLSLFHDGGWNNGSNSANLGQLQSDTWYHFAMTRDAEANFNIYLNGSLILSGSNPNSFSQGANGVIVGRDAVLRTTTNWSFLGLFDDIRLYDGALTGSQVEALAIPEPSTYAMIFGSAVLAGALLWRRRRT